MKSNSSRYLKTAALAIALLAAAGCSDDSNQGVKLKCEAGLVVCGNQCCDGTCENGVCKPSGDGNNNNGLCPTGFKECKGACVDHKTAHNHCGTCGHACENNETCVGGTCQADACPTGFEVCNGACVNKKIDAENCGTCGNTCGGNAYCANGGCRCPNGYSDCDNDMKNGCEAATFNCDFVCEDLSKVKCESGACCDNANECCGSACCGNDTTCCGDGICADLQTSAEHCGSCNNPCTDGKSCVEGTCERVCSGATPDLCEELDLCVNLANDALHCGDCSTRCDTTETCVEGTCTPSEVNCDADPDNPDAVTQTPCWGTCADLESDPANCGACGNKCLDGQTCESSHCECPPDTELCHDRCVDYSNDKDNCGSCGNKCLDDQTCSENTCVCPEGRDVCGDACVDYANDKDNCGSCGHACDGEEACLEGTCTLVCKNDTDIVCDATCVDKNTSNAHCGNCETACEPTSTCVEGTCTPSAIDCNAGLEADDPDYGKKSLCWGTCTDLSTDTKNCGVCGNACLEGQICTDAGCTCPEGATLCHDSCMTFDSDAENCGSCGNKCGKGQLCEGGECVTPHVITCFGKVTDILTDVNNCGACLHKCSTGETCTEGKCTLVCGDDYTLCNGACVNLQASAANCGACGKACADGQACFASEAGGYCDCETGRYDCDGQAANGCESTKPCACTPRATQSCWRGAPENLIDPTDLSKGAKGACQPGTQVCDDSGQFWGQCTGGVYPSAITCNDAGIYLGGDQNCDGIPDDQQECKSQCDLMAGDMSYIGCEYWPVYLHNHTPTNHTVVISNPNPSVTKIWVYKPTNYNNSTASSISAFDQFDIPANSLVVRQLSSGSTYMLSTSGITNNSYMLRASQPITVYQFNPWAGASAHTNDASLMLPTNVLGKEYMIMNWKVATPYPQDMYANTTIIAVEPGETTVEIQTKAPIVSGSGVKALSAGTSDKYTLNRFQVLNLQTQVGGAEQIGSIIKSDKKIAVYAGTKCSFIPDNVYACDHLEEQMFPIQAWGKSYLAVRTYPRGTAGDFWRILASEDNTTVTLPSNLGGTITLAAGEHKQIETTNSFEIQSNKPISVGQFMPGIEYNNAKTGDPSFILAVPYEQYRTSYTFSVPSSYDQNYLTVVKETGSKIELDNKELNISFTKLGDTKFEYGYVNIAVGTHNMTSDKPFGLTGYGFYHATSYGYPIGLDLKIINTN